MQPGDLSGWGVLNKFGANAVVGTTEEDMASRLISVGSHVMHLRA